MPKTSLGPVAPQRSNIQSDFNRMKRVMDHAFTGEYNARHRPRTPDPHDCQCGHAALQTPTHIILECDLLREARARFLRPATADLAINIWNRGRRQSPRRVHRSNPNLHDAQEMNPGRSRLSTKGKRPHLTLPQTPTHTHTLLHSSSPPATQVATS
jgi:hypothetical protein